MGVRADDHVERNGTRVQGTGNDNVQTTLGVRAYLNGKSAADRDTGREFQPYVEANWVHNAAQYGVRMNEVGDSMKGTRNAAELKAGVEAKVSSRLSVWGGVSGLTGDAGYSDVGATLGGRYSF